MHRVWVVIVSMMIVTSVGCGKVRYDERMRKTLSDLEYERRLTKNLMPPEDKKFKELSIYLRAPKDETPVKAGQLAAGEGQFDLDATFVDKIDATLHVLARVKLPKKAPNKNAPPPPQLPPRGEFNSDVLGVLAGVYGATDDLQVSKFKEEKKKDNRFKRLYFKGNDKDVQVWIYKEGTHEVALIFVFDPKLQAPLASKINLCLESFLVGQKATRKFNGISEEQAEGSAPLPL